MFSSKRVQLHYDVAVRKDASVHASLCLSMLLGCVILETLLMSGKLKLNCEEGTHLRSYIKLFIAANTLIAKHLIALTVISLVRVRKWSTHHVDADVSFPAFIIQHYSALFSISFIPSHSA